MIVDEVKIKGISARKTEYDPPVLGDRNRPVSPQITRQWMESQPWQPNDPFRTFCVVDQKQRASDALYLVRFDPAGIITLVEATQTGMPKTADHAKILR